MIKKLLRQLRRFRGSDDSGAAIVELALAVPPLVFIVAGIVDFGALMNAGDAMQAATRSVAEYARNSPNCAAGGLTNAACITDINGYVSNLKTTDPILSGATFAPSATAAGA